MNEELEKKIITLESIVSCQDQMLEDLNKAVIEQNKEIYNLQTEIDKVRSLVENLREEPDNRPPPHY